MKQQENELTSIEGKINDEKKKMSTYNYNNTTNDANTKFMVALGFTAHGKSTVCNRLYGDKSQYGDKGPPLTQMSFE